MLVRVPLMHQSPWLARPGRIPTMERRSASLRLAAAFILGIVAVAGTQPLPVPTWAADGDRLAAASLPAGVSVTRPAITPSFAVRDVAVRHGLGDASLNLGYKLAVR
jgi:hypothetical protein